MFCDLFAGTGAVGEHFKKKGYSIIANDLQYYSYVINRHRVGNSAQLSFAGLSREIPDLSKISDPTVSSLDSIKIVCRYLEGLRPIKGFLYKSYSPGGTGGERLYFSDDTSMRCDSIRQKIEEWRVAGEISQDEYYSLLCSLIESIDKYANTASVYGAFLKKLKKSAAREFSLQPTPWIIDKLQHQVFNQDINRLARRIEGDIVYLDPPYNQRQYSANYHILETIALYDNPPLRGKTGMREKESKSLYCSRRKVLDIFDDLIQNIKAKYIFLSYNNEGLMRLPDIEEIMSKRGKYGVFTKTHRRYKADSNRYNKSDQTTEYLHYVICD